MLNISAFKEIYDWFYGEASKERLLELMKNAGGIQRLKQLSQQDLAEFYCEGLAYSAIGPRHPLMQTREQSSLVIC
jgi:hypothetical protein